MTLILLGLGATEGKGRKEEEGKADNEQGSAIAWKSVRVRYNASALA